MGDILRGVAMVKSLKGLGKSEADESNDEVVSVEADLIQNSGKCAGTVIPHPTQRQQRDAKRVRNEDEGEEKIRKRHGTYAEIC